MKPIMFATLREAVRKKTFVVMGIVTVLYLVFWTAILYYFTDRIGSNADSIRPLATLFLSQSGLQFSSMILCLLTVMLSAGAVASDLENGTIHAILSRPLGRIEFILGKLAGLGVLVCAYATALFAAILLIGWAFSFDTVTALAAGQILASWVLYLLVPLCVLCLTLFGSTVLKVVPNGLLMIFIYILGFIGGMVEMVGNLINNVSVTSAGIFVSLLSPFHTLYAAAERTLFPSSGIAGDMLRGMSGLSGSGQPASAAMYAYIAVYALAFLGLAVWRFRRTDIN